MKPVRVISHRPPIREQAYAWMQAHEASVPDATYLLIRDLVMALDEASVEILDTPKTPETP